MADSDQDIWDSVDETEVARLKRLRLRIAEVAETTPRDERGRFAPKQAAEEQAEPVAQEAARLPSSLRRTQVRAFRHGV